MYRKISHIMIKSDDHTCPFLAVLPLAMTMSQYVLPLYALVRFCMHMSFSGCATPRSLCMVLSFSVSFCMLLSVSGCVASHDDVANSRTQPLMSISGSTQLFGHRVDLREYGSSSGFFLKNTLKKQPCHMMYRSSSTCTVCTRTALPCTALCHAPVHSPRSMHALSACFFQRVRIISCAVMCHVSVKHANRL